MVGRDGDDSGDASNHPAIAGELQRRLHLPLTIDDVIRSSNDESTASRPATRHAVYTIAGCIGGDHIDKACFGYRLRDGGACEAPDEIKLGSPVRLSNYNTTTVPDVLSIAE